MERNRCDEVGTNFSILPSELLLFPKNVIDVPEANKSSLCKKLSVLVFLAVSTVEGVDDVDDAMLLDCCANTLFPVGHAPVGLFGNAFLSLSTPPVVSLCDDVVMLENDVFKDELDFSLTDFS